MYNEVNETKHELSKRLSDLEDALPEYEEGNVIFPIDGEPGYRFNAEASTEVKNRIEEALSVARHNMVSFKRNQRSDTASLIQEQAICNFLAGDAIEARTWAFKN